MINVYLIDAFAVRENLPKISSSYPKSPSADSGECSQAWYNSKQFSVKCKARKYKAQFSYILFLESIDWLIHISNKD